MGDFPLQHGGFGLVQFEFSMDVLKIVRVLCDQGALFEVLDVFGEALFVDEGVDIEEELVPGDASEGVLDLGLEVARQIRLVDDVSLVRALLCMRCFFVLWTACWWAQSARTTKPSRDEGT